MLIVVWKWQDERSCKNEEHKYDDGEISRRDREWSEGKVMSRMIEIDLQEPHGSSYISKHYDAGISR